MSAPYLRAVAVVVAISTVASALVVLVRMAFGESHSPLLAVGMWCLTYLAFCLLAALQVGLSGRWIAAGLLVILTSPVALLVWFAARPVLTYLGLLHPVTP